MLLTRYRISGIFRENFISWNLSFEKVSMNNYVHLGLQEMGSSVIGNEIH